ncbi:MAG TPA: ABC transporter ATP-binding protein [Tepidiformaceae bacterium]|jgi:molybdate transport system ATP-binding protein
MSLAFSAARRLGPFSYEASLEANEEIVVLFGHSGAGKSVTLQMIAGLLRPESGRIVIDGAPVFDSTARVDLAPQKRNVGYVVQDLALFPHMTVAENIAFGLPGGPEQRARVSGLLELLQLRDLKRRRPLSLSGGQQQRVALARALARDTRLLLLDEPFSALDESLRAGLRRELLRLRKEFGLTILFVTHDLREAHLLADRLAVFDAGRILQFEDRETVFRKPLSRRVAELTGVANIFAATARARTSQSIEVEVAGLRLACALPLASPPPPNQVVDVAIRSERVNLRRGRSSESEPNLFEAAIVEEFAYGATHTLRLEPVGPGPAIEVEIAARPYEVLGVSSQRQWLVELPSEHLHVMPQR